MQLSDFYFELPLEQIAQYPVARGESRLLILSADNYQERIFHELGQFLSPGDLMIFNDTRVIPARLFGYKPHGGRVEILIERILAPNLVRAQIRRAKSIHPGMILSLKNGISVIVTARQEQWFELQFSVPRPVTELLELIGHIPLPPYIQRPDNILDQERYQTIYARVPGAIAAPTAGLHFNSELLHQLADSGIASAYITLHVGAGTFQPIKVSDPRKHQLHQEWFEVSPATVRAIHETRARGGRIIAVGTTSLRALESAARSGELLPLSGETNLFILPGYRFRVVDMLVTNFHLPESSLLMLVCAFAGYRRVMDAYRYAITAGYRFFSYGDAMLLTLDPNVRAV